MKNAIKKTSVAKPSVRTLTLPANSRLTQAIVDSLDNLFSFATPRQMKDHLTEVLLLMLLHNPTPDCLQPIIDNYCLLFEFLNVADVELSLGE